MASTNRESVLDAALVRPGRFDRQVEMHVPTLVERKEIFEVYLKNIVLDSSKNLGMYASLLAALTPGNTGRYAMRIAAAIFMEFNFSLSLSIMVILFIKNGQSIIYFTWKNCHSPFLTVFDHHVAYEYMRRSY